MTNRYTISDLKNICHIIDEHLFNEEIVFDYLRIVYLDKKIEEEAKNILFFPIYFTKYDIEDGWMINYVDYRPKIKNIMEKHPNYTFVVEKDMLNLFDNDKYNYLVVDNILEEIDKLYEYVLEKVKPKVVAVTGSVGKTTSVGLIEKVLSKKYKVERIYHKRITPILLKAHVINLLQNDIEYVVLENSIYFKDHVEVLSTLLKPYIACFLQLDSSHLHKDGMDTIEDLAINKAEIFRNAKVGFYNTEDKYIKRISLKDKDIYYDDKKLFTSNLDELLTFNTNVSFKDEGFMIEGHYIKPYLLTDLSLLQYALAYKVGKYLGVNKDDIVEALNSYVPVENRINKVNIFGKEVFFDGDVTTYERLKQLSKNKYKKKILVIRKFGSAENTDRFEQVPELFNNFDKVYLFDDIEYLRILKDYENVVVVNNHNFIHKYKGIIFYHYSGYFRDYDKVLEDNLLSLENDTYKIIPYKEGLK